MRELKIKHLKFMSKCKYKINLKKNSFKEVVGFSLQVNRVSLCCFFLLLFSWNASRVCAQTKMLDGVVAIVGGNPILLSEVESKSKQAKLDSVSFNFCSALESVLYQKLLFAQAVKDSVEVTDEQVEEELDRRLRQYIPQFGSIKAFENFLGKSIEKFKEESRADLREMLLVQKMQMKITDKVTVSPLEINDFYNAIPKDSIPLINAEIEFGHILRNAKINPELKKYAKEKLSALRDDIIAGRKDFATAAIINSMDPGSAPKGGLYENVQRGTFVPEFDAVAFRAKEKEVSEVFESKWGYHILKVESKRGDEIDVRHILIIPEPSPEDLFKAKTTLDSIVAYVKKDSISLAEAASRFSDDEQTKHNGGLIMNPSTGSSKFEMSELSKVDPTLVFVVDKLKTGESSPPSLTQSGDGKQAYHIIYVKSRTEPHRASLTEDYQLLQNEALTAKREKAVNAWIKKKIATTYVHIAEEYKKCKFENPWIN
jgi:peptidyl-prolyl cis-trans isomerase SurA